MAAQQAVEAATKASSSIGKTGQPLRVAVHVKWFGSNAPFTTDVLDLYASSHVDGVSQAVMMQQKLARKMPKPPSWYGQVCLRAGTGAALTMHPSNLKNYLNAFAHSSRPPKTAAQTKLDEAWDALAKDAASSPSTAPVTLYATQYSSVDAAVAYLQLNKPDIESIKPYFNKCLDQATKDNPRVVLCCFSQGAWDLDCSAKVNASKQVVLRRLLHQDYGRIGGIPIGSVPDHVLHDKDVTAAILKQNGWDPKCFAKYNLLKCEELQKYAQVMFDVKRQLHIPANTYSRNDVLQRVKMNGNALKLHVQYTDDKEIVLAAATCKRNTLSFRFLAWLESDMQDDEDVVCAALQNGASIEYASTRLQGDLRVARVAVAHMGLALEHLSDKLRKHRGLVLAACKQHGMALKHAHEAFKDDDEVVLVACRSRAEAIEFVSPRLRKTERVFLAVCTSMKPALSVYYPPSFRKYVLEFSAFFQTAMPSNKIVKQAIEKDLIRSDWWSAAPLNRFLTKSTVMWFIKAKPEVAAKFFDKDGIKGKNLDFGCKCVYSNWKLYGLLLRNYRQLTDYQRVMQVGDHERERLRSAAIAGFGPAKAAAVHWMDFADGWQTVLTARDWP